MQSAPPTPEPGLVEALRALVTEHAQLLMQIDWSDPEQLAAAEKRGRIIQVHRGNVEKTIGMNEPDERGTTILSPEDRAELERALERRLLRHIEVLGEEGLRRRVERRGLDTPDPRLGFPIPPGPEGTEE